MKSYFRRNILSIILDSLKDNLKLENLYLSKKNYTYKKKIRKFRLIKSIFYKWSLEILKNLLYLPFQVNKLEHFQMGARHEIGQKKSWPNST